MALLMAGISWQQQWRESSTQVRSSDLLSVKVWGAKRPSRSYRKAICLDGGRLRRTFWVDGTSLDCAQVTCTSLILLRVSKSPSPLGGLLSHSSVQNCWVLLSQLPHLTAGSAPMGTTSAALSGQWHQSPFVYKEGKNFICSSNSIFLCQ